MVMEQAEEYVDGEYKTRYSDCFIRGNNSSSVALSLCVVMYIAPDDS